MNLDQIKARFQSGNSVQVDKAMLPKIEFEYLIDRIEQLEKESLECGAGAGCCHQATKIEQLETALAECRDAMPSPAPGECPEQSWSEAIGDPLAVPAYVKETLARLERENAELRKDADRYRWIASDPYHDGYAWWTQDICILESDDSNVNPTKEQVDAAIDKAMK